MICRIWPACIGRDGRQWTFMVPALEAARQEAAEDHLGAALIRHGDSVIVR